MNIIEYIENLNFTIKYDKVYLYNSTIPFVKPYISDLLNMLKSPALRKRVEKWFSQGYDKFLVFRCLGSIPFYIVRTVVRKAAHFYAIEKNWNYLDLYIDLIEIHHKL